MPIPSTFLLDRNKPTKQPELTALRISREMALLGLLLLLYIAGRLLIAVEPEAADVRAMTILGWEKSIGLDIERATNLFVTANPALAVPASYFYAALHYTVTPAVLIWLWRHHARRYVAARAALVAATCAGLATYALWPVTPPRLVPRGAWLDTLEVFAHVGWWSGAASAPEGLQYLTNQYAAMPSLHAGWALWCGIQLLAAGRRWVRVAGMAYAATTAAVVVGTGNHWVFDVLAGWAIVLVAVRVMTGPKVPARRDVTVPRPGKQGPAAEAEVSPLQRCRN